MFARMSETGVETENDDREVILLAVTGMSPAVLTETIWALAGQTPAVLPNRVIVLTTAAGRERLQKSLFAPADRLGGVSPWDALRGALEAAGHDLTGRLRFGTTGDDLRVITAVDGATGRSVELEDLRSPADNEAAADFLLEQVRAVVENPDTRLVASLAGGRKTMGALLYACMTLAGRESDRLTHVLVNEPYEMIPDFWFPAQPGGPVKGRDGSEHDPALARVELADVPFVPLRNLFTRELNRKAGTFSRLVENCREGVRRRVGETLRLTLETTRPELDVNGTVVRLSPREHAVMLFLARRAKAGESPIVDYKSAVEPLNECVVDLVAQKVEDDFADWRYDLKSDFDEGDLRRLLSSIRGKLKQAGDDAALLATCLPERGRCSLEIPGGMIFIPGRDKR